MKIKSIQLVGQVVTVLWGDSPREVRTRTHIEKMAVVSGINTLLLCHVGWGY